MKKLRILILLFALSLLSQNIKAQVEIIADGRLQTILEQHISFNEISRTAVGYRIKIGVFTGAGSKQRAFDLRDEIVKNFPDLRAYVFFEEPNFTVKCGDYLTKLDAFGPFLNLKTMFPSASIIRDYINFPVLSKEDLVLPEYFEEEE
ncbi:MAG: hypothetical protein PHN41_05735 [Bacteroidales bacterium]|jgi:hypothetical protein|nr:hypothetical protein [Bacteroidales bacterium]MDD4703889.1 hypothetical protein [Bacteroidales bacterium]MDX9799351.1 hypothetical protein [Bacteroidales bacterium]